MERRKPLRIYLIANENQKDEIYFSVRANWLSWMTTSFGAMSAEKILSKAQKDKSAMLLVMEKDAVLENAI